MHGLIVIAALVMSTAAAAQTPRDATPVTTELARLDQQWQEAVVAGDTEFIEKRTASSF